MRRQGSDMIGTVARYQQIAKNVDRALGTLSQRADVKRETDYYLANIRNAKSADDFLKDDRLYRYAMTAFGLKDMIFGKAFIRKVLTEGVEGPRSFALQLSDPRFREFAETFNFARLGAAATTFDRTQQGTVDRYLRIQLEADAGKSDEGLRLALYFRRKAPDVNGVFGLMGDPALYQVVRTALGLPQSYSNTDVDTQAGFIRSKINIDDLKDPAKLDAFVTRFAARWQATNGAVPQTVPQVGLGRSMLSSFDNSLLLSMQLLRGTNR